MEHKSYLHKLNSHKEWKDILWNWCHDAQFCCLYIQIYKYEEDYPNSPNKTYLGHWRGDFNMENIDGDFTLEMNNVLLGGGHEYNSTEYIAIHSDNWCEALISNHTLIKYGYEGTNNTLYLSFDNKNDIEDGEKVIKTYFLKIVPFNAAPELPVEEFSQFLKYKLTKDKNYETYFQELKTPSEFRNILNKWKMDHQFMCFYVKIYKYVYKENLHYPSEELLGWWYGNFETNEESIHLELNNIIEPLGMTTIEYFSLDSEDCWLAQISTHASDHLYRAKTNMLYLDFDNSNSIDIDDEEDINHKQTYLLKIVPLNIATEVPLEKLLIPFKIKE